MTTDSAAARCGPPASEIPPKIDIWDDSPIHTVASSIEDQLRMEGYRVSPVTYMRAAQAAVAALDAPALRREDEGSGGSMTCQCNHAPCEHACDGASLVAAERRRQIEAEGWSPDHDDQWDRGEMAYAAAKYAAPMAPIDWPWDEQWWKPKDRLSNLVRAGALIAAEIDRMHRVEADKASPGPRCGVAFQGQACEMPVGHGGAHNAGPMHWWDESYTAEEGRS